MDKESLKAVYQNKYLKNKEHKYKAFAIAYRGDANKGTTVYNYKFSDISQVGANKKALAGCNKGRKSNFTECKLYDINGEIIKD